MASLNTNIVCRVFSLAVMLACVSDARIIFSNVTDQVALQTFSVLNFSWTWQNEDNVSPPTVISIQLLQVDAFVVLSTLTPKDGVSAKNGSFSWQVPQTLTTGRYWLAATDLSVTTIYGWAPRPDLPSGAAAFNVTKVTCNTHDFCPSNQYCDRTHTCYTCIECDQALDAIDGVCPAKCGGSPTLTLGQRRPDRPEVDVSGPLKEVIRPECNRFDSLVTDDYPRIVYDPNTPASMPNRMSRRLRDKLRRLADLVANVMGMDTQLRVVRAYIVAVSGNEVSLHNEGRAADIALTYYNGSAVSLEQLSMLAVLARLDWVYYESVNYLHVSVIPDLCNKPVDLVFLIDASGSIDDPLSGGQPGTFKFKMLPFVNQVVSYFNVSWSQTRVGVTTFASRVRNELFLNNNLTTPALNAAVLNIPYPAGNTYTSDGLHEIRVSQFTDANGMRPLSAGIPRVLIVVTDGKATDGHEPALEAEMLRANHVTVFSIGVGSDIDRTQLSDMASDPLETHVFTLKSYSFIDDLIERMSLVTCDAPAVLSVGESALTTVASCDMRYFHIACGIVSNLVLEVTTVQGAVAVYVSQTQIHPGSLLFDQKDDSNATVKTFVVRSPSGQEAQMYVAIQGIAANQTSEFSIAAWSDLFNGTSSITVNVSETAPRLTRVYQPPIVSGHFFTFSIVSGNDDGKFYVDQTFGVLQTVQPLDYDLAQSYRIRLSAQDNDIPCLRGVIDVFINVINVNNKIPSFGISPYTVSVPENVEVGTVVVNVTARDPDGSLVVYAMALRGARRDVPPLAINATTGAVSTTVRLDSLNQSTYIFNVSASDASVAAQTVSTTLTMTVTQVVCPAGLWSSDGTYPCSTATPCAGNEFQLVAPTPTTDRICSIVSECNVTTEFMARETTPTSDRVCTIVSACTIGQVETAAPTPTTDRGCRTVDFCASKPCIAGSNCTNGTDGPICTCPITRQCRCCSACVLDTNPPNSNTVSECGNPPDIDTPADANKEASSGSTPIWIFIVIAIATLTMLIIVIVVHRRRRRRGQQAITKPSRPGRRARPKSQATYGPINPLYVTAASKLVSSREHLLDDDHADYLGGAARAPEMQRADVRRIFSFDYQYHGRPLLMVSDDQVVQDSRDLMMPVPEAYFIEDGRTHLHDSLAKVIPVDSPYAVTTAVDEAVDLLELSMPDLLMELAISHAANIQRAPTREAQFAEAEDFPGFVNAFEPGQDPTLYVADITMPHEPRTFSATPTSPHLEGALMAGHGRSSFDMFARGGSLPMATFSREGTMSREGAGSREGGSPHDTMRFVRSHTGEISVVGVPEHQDIYDNLQPIERGRTPDFTLDMLGGGDTHTEDAHDPIYEFVPLDELAHSLASDGTASPPPLTASASGAMPIFPRSVSDAVAAQRGATAPVAPRDPVTSPPAPDSTRSTPPQSGAVIYSSTAEAFPAPPPPPVETLYARVDRARRVQRLQEDTHNSRENLHDSPMMRRRDSEA